MLDNTIITGIAALIVFFILAFQAVPIGYSFAIVGTLFVILFRGLEPGLYTLGSMPFSWASAQMIIPMPLFILMGYFTYYSGISQDLYVASYKWIGKLRGGVAMATVIANGCFAACCGSAMASAATMGAIAYPEMEKLNYDRKLSTGSISAGGTLAVLIPPSVPLILYGMLSQSSVADLFLAGILPGILLTILYLTVIYVKCRQNPQLGPPGVSFSWNERFASLKGIWSMLTLFILVIGGLYLGIFTPTEAGAIGAFGAFIIGTILRRLTFSKFIDAAKESGRVICFVVTLIIGAQIFNSFLGVAGFTTAFAEWINSLSVSPYVILTFIIGIYILLGMFLDIMAVILLTIPTLAPIMSNLGFDLVWFGIIITLLAMLGYITPPIGLNNFVVSGVTRVNIESIFRGVMPFVLVTIIFMAILVAFPQIVLFLPSLAK